MSLLGLLGRRPAAAVSVPSAKVTLIELAPAITWRAVRIAPWALTMTPAPLAVSSAVAAGRVAA